MIIVQKSYGDGVWHVWASYDSVAEAKKDLKGYCLAPGVSFRVLDHDRIEVFLWGPTPTWHEQAVELEATTIEVTLQRDTYLGWGAAAVDAARVLRPREGDRLVFKILTQDRLQVWVDRA